MSKQSKSIMQYLQEHGGEATAIEIGEAIGMEKRRVDSCFTATFINGGLGERDQTVTPSVLRLTEAGKAYVIED